jgi:hypothetical protein
MELLKSGEMKDWLLKIAIPWLWEREWILFFAVLILSVILLVISGSSQ